MLLLGDFFGFLLRLLRPLVGIYVAAVAASLCFLWLPVVPAPLLRSAALLNIILIIDQRLSTNSGRCRWTRKISAQLKV